MKIHIGRKFEFEACHFLPGKDIYGECSNLHGHRYELGGIFTFWEKSLGYNGTNC